MGRYRHVACSGVALRGVDDSAAGNPHHAATHMKYAVLHVDVLAAKLCQLTEPQPAPAGEQNHQPIPLRHLGHQHLEFGQRRRADAVNPFGCAGAPDVGRRSPGWRVAARRRALGWSGWPCPMSAYQLRTVVGVM